MNTMNRRTVLRGAGGAAIALPFLDIMMPARPARAQSTGGLSKTGKNGRPKRFLLIRTLNGQGIRWFANEGGPDGITKLGDVMAPMEKHGHKNDLILIDGLDNLVEMRAGAGGHNAFCSTVTCKPGSNFGPPTGVTIDQVIVKEIAGNTKFQSGIQLGIIGNCDPSDFLSVNQAVKPIAPYSDPQKFFGVLFADFQTDPLVFERAKAQRKSILDNVRTNYEQFVMKVGRDDKSKIQNHLDAIRELEVRLGKLSTVPSGSNVCMKPAMPAKFVPTSDDPGGFITKGRANMDLVAMAFACDLSRVATANWNNIDTGGGPLAPWIAPGALWHNISHGDPAGPEWNKGSTFMVDYFAGFIDRLKALQDGPEGSVWDNTLFYWTTECGAGNHNNNRKTILVAGSAGGYFKTNQRIVTKGLGHGDLFVSFQNAMGIPATTFGLPQFCKGPFPGLTA